MKMLTQYKASKYAGFTIVELLIVIVIIGILAAFVIVSYVGIQNRAHDTSVQSDLSAFKKKFELFKVDNDRYPSSSGATELQTPPVIKANRGSYAISPTVVYNLMYCTSNSHQNYALLVISKSGKRFWVSNTTGNIQEYTGSTSWNDSNTSAICLSVLPGSTPISGGYNSTSSPDPWRTWAGGSS